MPILVMGLKRRGSYFRLLFKLILFKSEIALVQPHPQGASSTIKRNHNFQPTERQPQTQKSKKKDEKAEKYSA